MKYSRLLDAVCFCVLTALTSTSYAAPVTGQGTWETTLEARDLDGDVSTIEAYFDNALNITWLADANHALTTGYDADGLMHWDTANTWAANLNPYGSGITGWRLPKVSPVNGLTFTYAFAYDGTTEFGYNISAPGTIYAESTASEMAHLFYNTLGNVAYYDTSGNGPQTGWGLTNTGPFSNIQTADFYWSSTESPANTNNAWFFNFDIGGQTANDKAYFDFFSWAVHDGDVGNPILSVPLVNCFGADNGIFDSPMDKPVTVNKRARVLPFNMTLLDENGYSLSDADIAPPMIQVVVTPGATDSAPPPEALDSVGKGDEGNQFSYSDTTWAFNLKTSNFSGSGRYTATVVSGDPSSYVISPTCEGTFYITR